MTFKSSYLSTKKIYEEFLSQIKGIKFTLREIDTIACILHSRSDKKIASILNISPRTVGTHSYNVMIKIGCNSKDQIIDFIENAGQVSHFREYYLHLLCKSHFRALLQKILSNLGGEQIKVVYNLEMIENERLFHEIKKDCGLVNISFEQITNHNCSSTKHFDINQISSENYYHDLASFIINLVITENNEETIQQTRQEFFDSYSNLEDAYSGKVIIEVSNTNGTNWQKYKKAISVLSVVATIALILGIIVINSNLNKQEDFLQNSEVIHHLEEVLEDMLKVNFSTGGTNRNSLHQNHNLFKKLEQLLDYEKKDIVKQYFASGPISSESLNNYLYNLNALASYYMGNWHDGKKANEILFHAKSLAESYVNNRSKIRCNFDESTPQVILTELSIVNDLASTYTTTIYLLGRSYLYMDQVEDSIKYFQQSKYMANKLNLFEAYLSDKSGLFRVDKYKASKLIEEGNIEEASGLLEKIMINHHQLISKDREYILNFRPNAIDQQKINPSKFSYSIIDSLETDINTLNKLLEINSDIQNKKKYLNQVRKLLSNKNINLPELFNSITAKKEAIFYNNLGNTLVLLLDTPIDTKPLIQIIKQKLPIKSSIIFDVAEELFHKAKEISRISDYSKADSCDGLVRLYKAKIKLLDSQQLDSSKQDIENLIPKIKKFEEKRDFINKQLNRVAIY